MCWTLQFIRLLHREALIRRIYESLENNGALVVAEKVLTNSSDMKPGRGCHAVPACWL